MRIKTLLARKTDTHATKALVTFFIPFVIFVAVTLSFTLSVCTGKITTQRMVLEIAHLRWLREGRTEGGSTGIVVCNNDVRKKKNSVAKLASFFVVTARKSSNWI
jgi:hypothetical protein